MVSFCNSFVRGEVIKVCRTGWINKFHSRAKEIPTSRQNYTSVDPKQLTVSKFRLKPVILISECFCSRCGQRETRPLQSPRRRPHQPTPIPHMKGDNRRQWETTGDKTTSEPKKPTTPTNTKAARSKVALRTPTVNCLGKNAAFAQATSLIPSSFIFLYSDHARAVRQIGFFWQQSTAFQAALGAQDFADCTA